MRHLWTTAAVAALCAITSPAWAARHAHHHHTAAHARELRGSLSAEPPSRHSRRHARAEARREELRHGSARHGRRHREEAVEEREDRPERAAPGAIHVDTHPPIRVRRGTTLLSISRETGVPVDELAELNHLRRPYHVRLGATIRLPSRRYYEVKSGDTLYSLGRRFGVDASDLSAFNSIGLGRPLRSGQRLYLPDSARDTEPPPAPERPAPRVRPSRSERATPAPTPPPTPRIPSPRAVTPRPEPETPPAAEARPETPPEAVAPSPEAPRAAPPMTSPAVTIPSTPPAVGPSSSTAPTPGRILPVPSGQPVTTLPPPDRGGVFARPQPAPSSQGFEMAPSRPPSSTRTLPVPSGRQIIQSAPPPNAAEVAAAGRGRFKWPVTGSLISGYGAKGNGQANDGLNISGAAGDPVRAAADGEVVYAGDQVPSFGNLVLVKHPGGWVTAYAHLGRILVKNRDQVSQGQQIGDLGQSGSVDRPQLHFEIRYAASAKDKAAPVDPMLLLPPQP